MQNTEACSPNIYQNITPADLGEFWYTMHIDYLTEGT